MICTSLNRIRMHSPCSSGWSKLLAYLGKTKADAEPLPLVAVLDSNGLDDALWCLRVELQHASIWRLLAVHYARQVRHLMKGARQIQALDVAESYARGQASDVELYNAWVVSRADALNSADDAACHSAQSSVCDAVASAAQYASRAAARNAATATEESAVWAAARIKQAKDLRTILCYYNAEPGEEIHSWALVQS